MSEDHVKTVVLDPPPARRVDQEENDDRRSDPRSEFDADPGRPTPLPQSWLT